VKWLTPGLRERCRGAGAVLDGKAAAGGGVNASVCIVHRGGEKPTQCAGGCEARRKHGGEKMGMLKPIFFFGINFLQKSFRDPEENGGGLRTAHEELLLLSE